MKIVYKDGTVAECPKDQELHVLRHTAAHIMAQAVKRLFPQADFGFGPATDKGFYYDIDLGDTKLSDEDLENIEKEMRKICKENLPIKPFILPRAEAVKLMEERGEKYKVEHMADLADETEFSFFQQGEYVDMCIGPHLTYTKGLKAFKITQQSGAYWKNDDSNKMLTRINGVAFASNEELEEYDIDYKDFVTRSDKAKEVVQEIIEQAEEEVGYKPPKYAFDLQIMMLPDEGLVLVLSEKEPLENKSGAQLLQALQEMKRVFEEKKAEIGAAEKKAQVGENAGESGKKNKKAAEAQKPQFAIFAFRNIGRVIEYAAVLPTNLRIDSTLYRMEDGTCYAYVRKGGASYERYSRACIQAMEFAALYAADEQKLRYLEEHGECLIREKALKKLRV